MKKRNSFILFPILLITLVGCSKQEDPSYDPFHIGNNLEVIDTTEAKLIASQAYNNLSRLSAIETSSASTHDDSEFYKDTLKNKTEKRIKNEKHNISIKSNMFTDSYTTHEEVHDQIYGVATEESKKEIVEWYSPVDESKDYLLLTKTSNFIGNNEYSSYKKSSSVFANQDSLSRNWNKYIINKGSEYTKNSSIKYSDSLTYARDGMHILAYSISKEINKIESPIASPNADKFLLTQTEITSIVAFVQQKDIGWVAESFAYQSNVYFLTNISGERISPLKYQSIQNITNYKYVVFRDSGTTPTYVEDSGYSEKLCVTRFNQVKEELPTPLIFQEKQEEPKIINYSHDETYSEQLTITDEFYRARNPNYDAHSYYTEVQLSNKYAYSIARAKNETTYLDWGFESNIEDWLPGTVKEAKYYDEILEKEVVFGKTFTVATSGRYSIDMQFNNNMDNILKFKISFIA